MADESLKFKYLTEFRYLMYQNPTLPLFFLGLPIRNGATFVTPNVPLLTLDLQIPPHYVGAELFYCVSMFNADWNGEKSEATLLPPEHLTHNDGLYMVASSSLVWDHGVVSCPRIINLVPFTGPTPSAKRSLSLRWLPNSSLVTKERLHKGFEGLGHLVLSIVFKTNGIAEIEFLSPYSVPMILIGQRELPLLLDGTTLWVSRLGETIGNRLFATFENSESSADKLTAQTLQAFFSASWGVAVSVEMERVIRREPRCAVVHFNSEREATAFLAGQACRTIYMGNRAIKLKQYVSKTPKN